VDEHHGSGNFYLQGGPADGRTPGRFRTCNINLDLYSVPFGTWVLFGPLRIGREAHILDWYQILAFGPSYVAFIRKTIEVQLTSRSLN
jgi:hypothetical protein